jgi:hypothetical protein
VGHADQLELLVTALDDALGDVPHPARVELLLGLRLGRAPLDHGEHALEGAVGWPRMMIPGLAPSTPDVQESLARTKRPCWSSSEFSPMYQTLPCLSWVVRTRFAGSIDGE